MEIVQTSAYNMIIINDKYTLIMVLLSLNNKSVISVILQLQTIVHIDSYICACVGHDILMH